MWGPLGTFSPVYLESPTPETYASGGSLSSSVVICRHGAGALRCLKAIPLEVPLLSTVIASPSLFTWVPLGIFLRLFKNISQPLRGLPPVPLSFFCLSFPHIPYHNKLSEPIVTDYLKTDLVHTPILIAYGGIPWTEEPGWLQSMGSQRAGHK